MTHSRMAQFALIQFVVAIGVASAEVPQALTIEPRNAKPGTVVSVTGNYLDKARVTDAFLTDHRFDLKVKVLEQTSTSLKFRVPPFVKPGRHQLLLQTAGETPILLEQPVYLSIELDDLAQGPKESEKDKDKNAGSEKGAANTTDKQ
jgi:hypothetical protein